jgi:MazG family protein
VSPRRRTGSIEVSEERDRWAPPVTLRPAIERLERITRRLRVECPWDREQDARSIVSHTVEEAYELADAARAGDDDKLLDELGDVLFQVHFLALLLEERGRGDIAAVADGMSEKLIRRHPHVFGGTEVADAEEVLGNWDRIKREREGRGAEDPFDDVPEALPALLHARKLQRRAVSAGLAGGADTAREALERAGEGLDGLAELAAADASPASAADRARRERLEEAMGEVLFQLVDVARLLRCDPELALRDRAARLVEGGEPSA